MLMPTNHSEPPQKFATIYADPPWDIQQKGARGAEQHYDLMTLERIKAMPVADLVGENAHLWIWVTNATLPVGYEVTTGIPNTASPRMIWRLDAPVTTKPPQCATLADPGDGRDQSAQGITGSGAGGIVDAVAVFVPGLPGPLAPDHDVVAACGQWTMAGHTSVNVRLTDAPHIDGAATLGMPVSTTHVITSSVMGVGATRKLSAVRWGVAGNIAIAWVLTIPAAALVGGVFFWIADLLV